VGIVHELDKIAKRPVLRMHAVIVSNVVAVVTIRRRVERLEPEACNADARQVIELAHQSFKVANAITIGVEVFLDIKTIQNGVFVPKVFDSHRNMS
jgi:hypothetical protein